MTGGTGRQLLLAALGGACYFLGFVGFGIWPLTFICFVPALVAIEDVRPRRALGLGALFGLVTHCGGYYWVVHLLSEFANLNTPLSVLGYVLLCAYQGFSLALVLWLVRVAAVDLKVSPGWSLPVLLVLAEWGYPFIFPSYIGNALYQLTWLTQIVDITGMLGLTALIGLVNGAGYELWCARRQRRAPRRRPLVATGAAVAVVLVYGAVQTSRWDARAEAAGEMKVAMVQTNLGARDKAGRRDEFIRRHQTMSREALARHDGVDLLVWPESAYNRYIHRSTKSLRRTVTDGLDVPLIFGALTYGRKDGDREVFNSAVLTSSTGAVQQIFDKVELLVFGETLPLVETFPEIEDWFPRSSTFTRGRTFAHFRVPFRGGDEPARILPMICYEDIIPAFVLRMWSEDGPADVLVNVTNDSWYGDTHEPLIHLVLASFRSIETRRAMIRSTNTGISAFVDPVRRITDRTGQWTREILVGEVPVIQDGGSTIYVLLGDVLGWAALGLTVAGVVVRRRRRRR